MASSTGVLGPWGSGDSEVGLLIMGLWGWVDADGDEWITGTAGGGGLAPSGRSGMTIICLPRL